MMVGIHAGTKLAVAAGLALTTAAATSQVAPPAAVASSASASPPARSLTVIALTADAYMVSGGISTTGFIIGSTGVIVIDAQAFPTAAKTVLADIAALTPKPVDAVILTHSDPDHINGLPAYPRDIAVIAQENTRRDIVRVAADPRSNGTPPPPEIRDYVPTRTVSQREALTLDGVRLVLIHTGPAHTDGDLIVYLPAEKLVYAGDLLAPDVGMYPGIHLEKHGSSLGWIGAINAMLALDADRFVAGHGGILTRDEVEERLHTGERRRAEVKAMVDRHMSLAEIKASLHDMPLPGVARRFPTFIETTYAELTSADPTH